MSKLRSALAKIRTLEDLAIRDTVIHRLHPMAKIITTAVYLVIVVSFDKHDLSGLVPFTAYPAIVMALSETPYRPMLARLAVALPFSALAALSNIVFERAVAVEIYGVAITFGVIAFLSILFKTVLTVMAVLILAATTPMEKTAHELIRLRVPKIFVIQLMLTFRYIGTLIEETSSMLTAYHLRSPQQKGIELAHLGPFAGQLILRSFGKAERIYYAMKCRGFDGEYRAAASMPARAADITYAAVLAFAFVGMRLVNVSVLLGNTVN